MAVFTEIEGIKKIEFSEAELQILNQLSITKIEALEEKVLKLIGIATELKRRQTEFNLTDIVSRLEVIEARLNIVNKVVITVESTETETEIPLNIE